MNRSIHTSFVLVALVILMLTLAAPYMSRAEEGESKENAQPDTAPATNTSEQLQDVFERIGVGSDQDTATESERSWVDRVTSPFKDTNESEPLDNNSSDLLDTRDIGSIEETTTDESVLLLDEPVTAASPVTPETAPSPASGNVVVTPANENHPTSAPVTPPPDALTLDEYLERVRNTPHVKQEAFHTSLAERRRLAVAMRATLEAAEQVAEFGLAGTQLLQDASLDTVVATMIADQERKAKETQLPGDPVIETPATAIIVTPEEPIDEYPTDFDTWRLVYIVEDGQGERVGWRHTSSGERTSAYVGHSLTFGNDTVSVVRVATGNRGRYLIIEVNGERRDVHLF